MLNAQLGKESAATVAGVISNFAGDRNIVHILFGTMVHTNNFVVNLLSFLFLEMTLKDIFPNASEEELEKMYKNLSNSLMKIDDHSRK